MTEQTPLVGIIMGSKSDMPAMEPCMEQLDAFGVPYEVKIASAHRKPDVVHEWAAGAHGRGMKVIIAAAGKAAHLGGVVAAFTPLPVITVPHEDLRPGRSRFPALHGADALGRAVACVAINGAKNAAVLAVQMMGTGDEAMRGEDHRVQARDGGGVAVRLLRAKREPEGGWYDTETAHGQRGFRPCRSRGGRCGGRGVSRTPSSELIETVRAAAR